MMLALINNCRLSFLEAASNENKHAVSKRRPFSKRAPFACHIKNALLLYLSKCRNDFSETTLNWDLILSDPVAPY